MNNQQKQQVLEQIKQANNVLVAVSTNPSVDELAASVGLTLMLNKLDKHATTVFSGIVPSTIEFLQPEKTIETTTDSLRDFIIALDKSKADKLRYKVEDDVVRIFITPYRTSISERDLQFSQGDFNVDLVLAIGVTNREDLDRAITAHGRILHDATVISFTAQNNISDLGTLNWQEPLASSLCEMVAAMIPDLPQNTVDGQTSTSLLTGIISETDRFRNQKTTPTTLSIGSQLMQLGANQQLIADKLEAPEPAPMPTHMSEQRSNPEQELAEIAASVRNGELEIRHEDEEKEKAEDEVGKIHIDEHGNLGEPPEEVAPEPEAILPPPFQPPKEELEEIPPQDDSKQKRLTETDEETASENEDGQEKAEKHPGDSLLKTPSATPLMMSHEKIIMPPNDQSSNKPFDIQQAMREASDPNYSRYVQQKKAQPGAPLEPVTIPPFDQNKSQELTPEAQRFVDTTPPMTPPQETQSTVQAPPFADTSASGPYASLATPPDDNNSALASSTQYQPPVQSPAPPPPPKVPAWTPPPEPVRPQQPVKAPLEPPQQGSSLAKSTDSQTLRQLEEALGSKHVKKEEPPKDSAPKAPTLEELEDAVARAANAKESAFPTPTQSVGAANVDLGTREAAPQKVVEPKINDPTAPPPVPPPMTPQFFDGDGSNNNPISAPKQ